MKPRKLQVFISSTYENLKAERQAAVMAILEFGHIPAGMELFAAGDAEQLKVIKRWIDESDVFLLILGREYGSIEPISNKSYIQLEYEHAIATRKPFFAIVMHDEILGDVHTNITDLKHQNMFISFRTDVLTRMVAFWKDYKDIKLGIVASLSEIERREIKGWIRESGINYELISEQLAEANKKNTELQLRLSAIEETRNNFNDLTYEEFIANLSQSIHDDIKRYNLSITDLNKMRFIKDHLKDQDYTLLHYLWAFRDLLGGGTKVPHVNEFIIRKLSKYDLIETIPKSGYEQYKLSSLGKKLITHMELKYPNIN